MKEFFSYIIIIFAIGLIGYICYMIWKKSNGNVDIGGVLPGGSKPGEGTPKRVSQWGRNQEEDEPEKDETTVVLTEWSVAQLDPGTGKPIKKMNIVIPSSGKFVIGRADNCDFVLRGVKADDGTSREHLGVGKDPKGYYAKPLVRPKGTLALTYIDNVQIVKSFDLTDQQIVWLGNTPIVFLRNTDRRSDLKYNAGVGNSKRDEATFERDRENTMLFGRMYDGNDDVFCR